MISTIDASTVQNYRYLLTTMRNFETYISIQHHIIHPTSFTRHSECFPPDWNYKLKYFYITCFQLGWKGKYCAYGNEGVRCWVWTCSLYLFVSIFCVWKIMFFQEFQEKIEKIILLEFYIQSHYYTYIHYLKYLSEIYFFRNEVRIYLYVLVLTNVQYHDRETKHDNHTVFEKEIAWSGRRGGCL